MYNQEITDEMNLRFGYHPPRSEERKRAHAKVREEIQTTATVLALELPEGREKSLVLTKLEEAMFWANAAIARSEDPHAED